MGNPKQPGRTTSLPATCAAVTFALILIFTADSSEARAFKIAAAGDVACPASLEAIAPTAWHGGQGTLRCQGAGVAAQIDIEGPNRILALGDLNQYGEPTSFGLANFERTWKPFLRRVRPTIGNHDYLTNVAGPAGSDPYFRFWRNSGLDSRFFGRSRQLWASWKQGGTRFIALNSNCDRVACGGRSAQANWLRSVLRRERKKGFNGCTVAYFHHPLVSAGSNAAGRSMEGTDLHNLWRILHRFRTDLILNGHQHYYERHARMDHRGRLDRTGPVQIITGTGGFSTWAPEGDLGRLLPSSRFALESTGATIITLRGRSWSSHFRTVKGGKLDPVSSKCLAKPRLR